MTLRLVTNTAAAAETDEHLLSLSDLLSPADAETRPAGLRIGVELPNDVDVDTLDGRLNGVDLIVLHFPKWTDGRAYSQARVLRARLSYAGEIRATGEVLVDMAPLLARCGFDVAVLADGQRLDLAERSLGFFADYYQGDAAGHRPVFAQGRA